MNKIIVVGIGPGNPDYILPAAQKAISAAKVLVGGRRALSDFARPTQRTMAITRDIEGVMAFIKEALTKEDVVVMVSGDPGYYSLLDALRREFPPENLEVIPGLSSLQLAFARLALPWHDARLLSFHGRQPKEEELLYERGAILGLLTDANFDSHTIPAKLLALGWPGDAELYICEHLSYEDEKITATTLAAAGDIMAVKHAVLVVKA